jgi:AcrR family transcriptional regulator
MEHGQGNRRARGRPSRSAAQRDDIRAHIARCALRLFQQEGYAAVSMRKLAAEAGCTPKTVYAYFHAKVDILSLLWSDVFAALFDELDALAAAEPDPVLRLEEVAQAYVDFWLEHREHYFLVFMSGGLSRADVEGYVATGVPSARFGLFARCLADALGEAPDGLALRAKSEALVCALNGISQALITISGHAWTPPETLVHIAVHGVLK